jgi:hypothetical protein
MIHRSSCANPDQSSEPFPFEGIGLRFIFPHEPRDAKALLLVLSPRFKASVEAASIARPDFHRKRRNMLIRKGLQQK